MGWLFAVALGLHRQSRRIVATAWVPIALGHAAAGAIVLIGVPALGFILDHKALSQAAGALLLGWAVCTACEAIA
jgi:hypothetical protein